MLLRAIVIAVVLIVGSESFANPIKPNQYSVQFRTEIHDGNDSYDGIVWIRVEVAEPVARLELHARSLTIKSVTLINEDDDSDIEFVLISSEEESDVPEGKIVLKILGGLPTGSYRLKINFSGIASDNDVMFKGSYEQDNHSVAYYLMSKPRKYDFTQASTAFPHFGEEFKSTFSVSINHHKTMQAWSNMPLQESLKAPEHEDYVISRFQETAELHPYDVGFFVSDFDSQKFGKLTLVARKEVLKSMKYVATLGNDLIQIMDNYTNIHYTGPITDYLYIAIPHELSSDNLTEFERKFTKEEHMIFNRQEDTFNSLAEIFETSSQNLMQQWLTNLIAPQEERLHRAFSNIYTYFNAEKVYPEERLMMHYQMKVLQGSLSYNYERPSCVLNMFWLIVFDEKWREIMRNLSKNRRPRTLTTAELCEEAQKIGKEDYNLPEGMTLEAIFNQWMYSDEEPPVLTAQRIYSDGKVILSQDGADKVLPYNFATKSSHFDKLGPFRWLVNRNETVQFDVSDDHWIIFNKEQFGFYRVNYDERNWRMIIQALRSNASSIHCLTRMHLLDDVLHFVKNDQLSVTVLLELLTYLRNEMFYVSWYNAYNIFTSGYYPEIEPPNHIKTFFLRLIDPYYQSFASQDITVETPQMELKLHADIAGLACWLGMEDCIHKARSRFHQAMIKNSAIEPNWASMIYCYGLQNASDEDLEWLLSRRSKHQSEAEYLKCVDNEKHMRRVLMQMSKSSDNVETIIQLISSLDESRFKLLHSSLKSDPELVQLLEPATIEEALGKLSTITKSKKTLQLIDDLEASLGLEIIGKGSGSNEDSFWDKPEVADFIEHYMKNVN